MNTWGQKKDHPEGWSFAFATSAVSGLRRSGGILWSLPLEAVFQSIIYHLCSWHIIAQVAACKAILIAHETVAEMPGHHLYLLAQLFHLRYGGQKSEHVTVRVKIYVGHRYRIGLSVQVRILHCIFLDALHGVGQALVSDLREIAALLGRHVEVYLALQNWEDGLKSCLNGGPFGQGERDSVLSWYCHGVVVLSTG